MKYFNLTPNYEYNINEIQSILNGMNYKNLKQITMIIIEYTVKDTNIFKNKRTGPYNMKLSKGKGFSVDLQAMPKELLGLINAYCNR